MYVEIGGTRPLLLGYVRQQLVASDRRMDETIQRLRCIADRQGFILGTVFVEPPDANLVAFGALVEAVERHRALAVVLPNLLHFALLWPPSTIRSQFEHLTGARVLLATECSAPIRRAGVLVS
jgi:hypothetical protein